MTCPYCKEHQLHTDDKWCGRCGRPCIDVTWRFAESRDRIAVESRVPIRPDAPIFFVLENHGLTPARIVVTCSGTAMRLRHDHTQITGEAPLETRLFPNQPLFLMLDYLGQGTWGEIVVQTEDGLRESVDWWQPPAWQPRPLPLHDYLILKQSEQWLLSTPTVVFPAQVSAQKLLLWNDSEQARSLVLKPPFGYSLYHASSEIVSKPIEVAAGHWTKLTLRRAGMPHGIATEAAWNPAPQELPPVPLALLPTTKSPTARHAIVAIDFGTCNTRVAVRWCHAFPGVYTDEVVNIGDGTEDGKDGFPTVMALYHTGKIDFGYAAARAHFQGRLNPEQGDLWVENLKTYLRRMEEPFPEQRHRASSDTLLHHYFRLIVRRLRAYFETAIPGHQLDMNDLTLHFVLTRPVLDANADNCYAALYEDALCNALTAALGAGETLPSVSFIDEPTAAALGLGFLHRDLLRRQIGRSIGVVDCGGGTTDIAFGTVRAQGSTLAVEVAGVTSLRLPPTSLEGQENADALELHRALAWSRKAVSYAGSQAQEPDEVGGNTLDASLAYCIGHSPGKVIGSDPETPVPDAIPFLSPKDMADLPSSVERLYDPEARRGLSIARKLKEATRSSTRVRLADASEQSFFEHRPELEAFYLNGNAFQSAVIRPTIAPLVALAQQQMSLFAVPSSLKPESIETLVFVGGSSLLPALREELNALFPNAAEMVFEEASVLLDEATALQTEMRRRMDAVVLGAVWSESSLITPAPFQMEVEWGDNRRTLAVEGEPLPAEAPGKTLLLGASNLTAYACGNDSLELRLLISGTVLPAFLPQPVCAARGFYRNRLEFDTAVFLSVTWSESYVTGYVTTQDGSRVELWTFSLKENDKKNAKENAP